jgi:segregation and condensation protein B
MEEVAADLGRVKTVLEAALLTSQDPMSLAELRRLFAEDVAPDTVRQLIDTIRLEWADRGVELVTVASGWRFRAKPEMQTYLDRLGPQKPPKYSRAVLETLAIIAYRQPVTRGDIEDVRGVTVSTNIIKALETRGWIEVMGTERLLTACAVCNDTAIPDDLNCVRLTIAATEDLGAP